MNSSSIGKKELFFSLLIGLLIVSIEIIPPFFDTRTTIAFCNVGQGDAAYIRIKNKIDLLIDAGPDRKILGCLGKHMPFYDRKIEIAMISHPQRDHFGGFLYLLDRYKIDKLLITRLDNPSQSFQQLKEKVLMKNITIIFPQAGTKINILDDNLTFYWPTEEFIASKLIVSNSKNVLGTSSLDDNYFSLVFLFEENSLSASRQNFRALFTGDVSPFVLNSLLNQPLTNIQILKVPHHGSKNGLTKEFLQLTDPQVSVISVGKNNSYGHPAKEILDMLKASKIDIRRTDERGNIVFRIK